jgi:DNA methylase
MAAKETELFKTKVVKAKEGSGKLFEEVFEKKDGPVTCLGMKFKNDDARREYFTEKLREKLKDPEFRQIEGFPIGEDEDILALSDPPYYTACPNPWVTNYIEECENQKAKKPEGYHYHREPFAADVTEGRSGLFYDAHSYHTKVPYKAIMRYLLHYTNPGDVVFDGFCGTGMTGVAAQMCGDREIVESLGYKIKSDGTVLQQEDTGNGKKVWAPFSKIGNRKAILNDLSPAATFIAYNYNKPVNTYTFKKEAERILSEIEKEIGWMYETLHIDGETIGKINYTIWSDVYNCPVCTKEIIFWDTAVNKSAGKIKDDFHCPTCNTMLSKTPANQKKEEKKNPANRRPIAEKIERSWLTKFDPKLNDTVKQAKQIPVMINYSITGRKGRFEKKPDQFDLDLLERIKNTNFQYNLPIAKIPKGDKTGEPINRGITYIHHFYTLRNLTILSALREKAKGSPISRQLLFLINSYDLTHSTLMSRIIFKSGGKKPVLTGYQSGTLYVPSVPVEKNIIEGIRNQKLGIILKSLAYVSENQLVSTISSHKTAIPNDSVEYIFIDPPFGSNIMYSELNFLSESWQSVITNNKQEAIENRTQSKTLEDYRRLMTLCFKEAYRILKPGHWMTVEFSNTKAAVWNNIQTAISDAGFIVANVAALDKKQGSFNAVTNPTSVKQDLVISVYKPNGGFERRFINEAESEEGVWDFIRTHLKYLPVIKRQNLDIIAIPERDPRILFDQVVAYYFRKGINVPISSKEFQIGLEQRFPERDGMYFLSEQVAEYDKKKMAGGGKYKQMEIFVSDESSAIEWLRRLLKEKPQTTSDINPQFIQETQRAWKKSEQQVELSDLLELNFLCYHGESRVPSQIHAYLSSNFKDMRKLEKDDPALMSKAKDRWYVPDPNEAEDREKVREKSLLRDFEQYKQTTKKLKVFRLEAMRAGFKKAFREKEYQTIIDVAQKIPGTLLEEDPELLRFYDYAVTRTEK